ncbi:MAG: DUF6383 domain-containing protein [Dysgonamonadaceae bacterium]|jgi:hypothetical protein|nr:DUF6383 domain-containing protein [Dysgonamonadaceae bacterium]
MKKIFTLLLVLIFASNTLLKAQFSGGNGTETTPYIIKTAEQLSAIRDNNGASGSPKYFVLENDINLGDFTASTWGAEGWLPIGVAENGSIQTMYIVLDGANHKITGFRINRPNLSQVALFAQTSTGSAFKNLGLEIDNAAGGVQGGSTYCAAFVAKTNSATNFDRCYVYGNVSATQNAMASGLFVGSQKNGTISDCYAEGEIKGNMAVGGFVGTQNSNANCLVKNCYSNVTVTPYIPMATFAGGLVGDYDTRTYEGKVEDSYYNNELNTADVFAAVGYQGFPEAGRTESDLRQQDTFENWDFASVWKINEGESMPYFRWQSAPLGTGLAKAGKTSLNVVASNGVLKISGLAAGQKLNVYNLNGLKIADRIASGSEESVSVSQHGVYIVSAGNSQVKAIF